MRRAVVTKLAPVQPAASAFAPLSVQKQAPGFDIFVSTPMSAYASDEVAYKYNRDMLLGLFRDLKERSGFSSFFCPAVLCNDLASFDGEQDALAQDFHALEQSSAFLLYYLPPLPEKPSSVFVEAGMALNARMPSIYIVRSRADLPYMLRGADRFLVDGFTSPRALAPRRAVPGHPPRESIVKIVELAEGETPDAAEIGRWLDQRIERRARAGYC